MVIIIEPKVLDFGTFKGIAQTKDIIAKVDAGKRLNKQDEQFYMWLLSEYTRNQFKGAN